MKAQVADFAEGNKEKLIALKNECESTQTNSQFVKGKCDIQQANPNQLYIEAVRLRPVIADLQNGLTDVSKQIRVDTFTFRKDPELETMKCCGRGLGTLLRTSGTV